MQRRNFIKSGMAAAFASCMPFELIFAGDKTSSVIHNKINAPVLIKKVSLLRLGDDYLIKVEAKNGATGMVPGNNRMHALTSIMNEIVKPYFIDKDARDISQLVEDFYYEGRAYKYAGMPLWNCVAHVEMAILDMLGKLAGIPVYEFFGKSIRNEVPVYLTTFDRHNTAEVYVDNVVRDLEKLKINAVKIKVGGRMSRNADCLPGRTEKLVPLLRKELGENYTLYADANGSYDAEKGTEVGRLLQDYNFGFFEEPCPWQDFVSTQKVTQSIEMPVAGGEQDNSLEMFHYIMDNHVLDIVQPDLMYCGGFIRALKIAAYGQEKGYAITCHAPRSGAFNAIQNQFYRLVPNIGSFQEYLPGNGYPWCTSDYQLTNGKMIFSHGTGWGIQYDEQAIKNAVLV